MTEHDTPANRNFNPSHLLDTIIERMHLKNDAALCRLLSVAPPIVSKIRRGRVPIGASMLIRMNEDTHISIVELRELMGDRRAQFRMSVRKGSRLR